MPERYPGSFAIHRTLHRAVIAEQQARAFYRRMSEAYGARAPLPSLLSGSEKRLGWLMSTCQRHGAPAPVDTFGGEEMISGNWLDDCVRAVRGEERLARLYSLGLFQAGSPDIAALFGKLQRQSVNSRLPVLLRAVEEARRTEQFHAMQGVPREEAHLQHGLLTSFLEKTFSILGAEHRALGLFAPVLRNTNPALLTGLAVGGAMAYALKKRSPSKRKEG